MENYTILPEILNKTIQLYETGRTSLIQMENIGESGLLNPRDIFLYDYNEFVVYGR